MNNSLLRRLESIEGAQCQDFGHLAALLPEVDAYIADCCNGDKPPTINLKGARWIVLAMQRLCEYWKALAGIQYSSYEEFQKPFTEGSIG